ncbi:uncharacterized protein EAE97_005946 [Botrytis byssoidea]|uniref:Uncharacterized protein n=1 Tax=Botrytis byssoidea TaxID=139641 RepID=A0A9P5ISM2_9HELO|nr:uncharacterized protein EAE97_005946 [Botrytis byssoidea]KAF7943876.1 hypothetical protein EAE97_005946 [Botrytis byssoidea]
MAGFKLRKEKPAFEGKGDTGNKKRTYFYTPDIEAIHRKDNEIHFLRVLSFTAIFTTLILIAYYRWKVAQLEKILKIKDEHYIGKLTGGVVLMGEHGSVYMPAYWARYSKKVALSRNQYQGLLLSVSDARTSFKQRTQNGEMAKDLELHQEPLSIEVLIFFRGNI